MTPDSGSANPTRVFARPRLSAETQTHKLQTSLQGFQPLPAPTGAAPYRLSLADVIGAKAMAQIQDAKVMRFHLFGDCGGINFPLPQQAVADAIEADFADQPAPVFLYLCGDVIYFNGRSADYYGQFYEPYLHYPAPIFAVPGNHDGDALDPATEPSLTGFVRNFCSPTAGHSPDARDVERLSMTQPNVYWTLLTPFLTFVGVYSNVPEGGEVDKTQAAWLAGELEQAPSDLPVAVCLHHPVYSADVFHGGSQAMGALIDQAAATGGRHPDIVFTAHVHNYQRFNRAVDGKTVPYLVVGAGGYWHLHAMAKDANGNTLVPPWTDPTSGTVLASYCDSTHGYLRVDAAPELITCSYVSVPSPNDPAGAGPTRVIDTFTILPTPEG